MQSRGCNGCESVACTGFDQESLTGSNAMPVSMVCPPLHLSALSSEKWESHPNALVRSLETIVVVVVVVVV